MAGLLAWAADVVGGHGKEEDGEQDRIPLVFTPEQQKYAEELDRKAVALSRSIQDLRLRLPPPDISQRLPHLLAHSLASNAALALQLNSHSATREQAQMREQRLMEENSAYEKAITDCETKLQEKRLEAESLLRKLKELEDDEKNLTNELEVAQDSLKASQAQNSGESVYQADANSKDGPDAEAEKSVILEKLESKKKELSLMEEQVQDLENKWAAIQERALKQPSPAQREKTLDKQLHSLIEQLAAKQSQAEGLVNEIHTKEMELERLNGLWKRYESSSVEGNTARNRFARTNSDKGSLSDHEVDAQYYLPYSSAPRNNTQTRVMYLRSAFVIYILALHILVFIKISF